MGNKQNEIKNFDLFCNQCYSHYLFEIFTKKNIHIRKYCFCGESTFIIDERIKFLLTDIDSCGPAYKMISLHKDSIKYNGISYSFNKATKFCPTLV